jgi:peroxiredoxin
MSATPSNMMPLGTKAPSFSLPNPLTKKANDFNSIKGTKVTVVMFICNHCPFVLHLIKDISKLGRQFNFPEVAVIAISSNDIATHPQDGPEEMAKFSVENNLSFPYLYDEDQSVAKAFDAACTPDFFVFNKNQKLAYRGQYDDSRPGNDKKVTGKDLVDAVKALLTGEKVNDKQVPSIGCNIKWKNEQV